jgi:spermidine/putrescine transport system ATP-binding protein
VTVDTKHGSFIVPTPDPAPAKGDVLELMISADLATVSDTAGEYENMITGELISEEFIGSVITLYIDIGEGTVFRVQKQQHELDALGYTAGSKLFASWRPEDTYILPPA